jgi:hypothetical protein
MITLPLGTTARLIFKNAINESQALQQLRSAFPQLMRGLLKEKGADESQTVYWEPEIELQENK